MTALRHVLAVASMVLSLLPNAFAATWTNTTYPSQIANFGLSFDVVPSKNNEDLVIGAAGKSVAAYTDLAAIVRFSQAGVIDARSADAYKADVAVRYSAGLKYHIYMWIRPSNHTYDVYVTPSGKSQVKIAASYSFRTEQQSLSSFNDLAWLASIGGGTISNIVKPSAPLPTPTPTPAPTPVPTPLPTPTPVPGTISFKSTFDEGIVSGSALGAWASEQVVTANRLQLVSSPSRKGKALRVEVDPGDRPLAGLQTERAEVLVMKSAIDNKPISENKNSGTQFYALSVLIPTDWQTPNDWATIFQLHGCDAFATSPAFSFSVMTRSSLGKIDEFAIDLNAGYFSGPNQYHMKHLSFSNGTFNKGHWTDFVLQIKWATDTTGLVNVWRREEGQTAFTQVLSAPNVATLQYAPSVSLPSSCGTDPNNPNHYWKSGLYRNASPVTNIFYLSGGPVRGTTFDAVVQQAFP